MPLYEVSHTTPLSPEQQQKLATSITHIHSRQFKTPSVFVNVVFKDVSQQGWFVGGKKRPANSISAHVRPGGGRSTAEFDDVCKQVASAWDEAIKPQSDGERLRSVFVLGTIMTGWEAGFTIPPAGQDKQWLKDNWAAFEKKAAEGDEDIGDMVREVKTRDDLGV